MVCNSLQHIHIGFLISFPARACQEKTINSYSSPGNLRGFKRMVGIRKSTDEQVDKRGAVGTSIDVIRYSGCYDDLKQDLARRFGIKGQLEDRGRGVCLQSPMHQDPLPLETPGPSDEFGDSANS
ncbi:hypothetical protein QUC31_002098 [Theobroma cacao]